MGGLTWSDECSFERRIAKQDGQDEDDGKCDPHPAGNAFLIHVSLLSQDTTQDVVDDHGSTKAEKNRNEHSNCIT